MNWADRQLKDSGGMPTVEWDNMYLNGDYGTTVDWNSGVLYKPNNGAVSLNWNVGYAKDPSGSGATVNWNTGQLWANDNTRVLNWKLKTLIGGWST